MNLLHIKVINFLDCLAKDTELFLAFSIVCLSYSFKATTSILF